MPEFIPGIELAEIFYREAAKPVLDRLFPGLPHAAAHLGYGSDVMGYDTPVSRDHGWGPRFVLFLPEDGFAETRAAVNEALRHNLPVRVRGYSTHFGTPDPTDGGLRPSTEIEQGPVDHIIRITTLRKFWMEETGANPLTAPSPADWLTIPEQQLLHVTAGRVFHDEVGLEAARARFAYYPRDVWIYLLAAQWALIGQEEAFVGRTHQAGDELGSKIIAARLCERLMRMCFFYEKRYAPYSKWFGIGFKTLACYGRMGPLLEGAAAANDYKTREGFIASAYSLAVEMLNDLHIIAPIDPVTHSYSNWHMIRVGKTGIADDDPSLTRPHRVIFADRISHPLQEAIRDPAVLALKPYIGSISQFATASSDAGQDVDFTRRLADDLLT